MQNLTCCCCFDDEVDLNHAVSCHSGHISCTTCVNRALQVAVGDRQKIKCFAPDGCDNYLHETAIRRACTDLKLLNAYDNVVALANVHAAELEHLHKCPFCDNAEILDSIQDDNRSFHCNSCEKSSCRLCNQLSHDGACDAAAHIDDEQETEKFIITCKCGTRFYRGDGCNKIQCSNCRKAFCWICKKTLGRSPYDHFYQAHAKTKDQKDKCPLYGERKIEIEQIAQPQPIAPVVVRRGRGRPRAVRIPPPAPYAPPVEPRRRGRPPRNPLAEIQRFMEQRLEEERLDAEREAIQIAYNRALDRAEEDNSGGPC